MNHDSLNPSINKLINWVIRKSLSVLTKFKDKIKFCSPYMTVERLSNVFYLLDYQLLNTKRNYSQINQFGNHQIRETVKNKIFFFLKKWK